MNIKQLQELDPVDIVEKAGGDIWDSFALMSMKTDLLNRLYKDTNDTKFSDSIENYMKVCKDLGFQIIYQKSYTNTSLGEKREETNYVMYHPTYYLLLKWDTFMGHRNSASLYFNLISKTLISPSQCSGHWLTDYTKEGEKIQLPFERKKKPDMPFEEWVKVCDEYEEKLKAFREQNDTYHIWVGHKDAREGLRFSINEMLSQGEFLPWVETPFLWFLTSEDTKDDKYDYNEINTRIISTFPKEVRDKLNI